MHGIVAASCAVVGTLIAAASNNGMSPEILVGIGTIVVAILGPFAATQLAHKLATHESRKRAIADLFVGIARHIQEFEDALSFTNIKTEKARAAEGIGACRRQLYTDCIMIEFLLGGTGRSMDGKLKSLIEMTLPWGSHDDLFEVYPEKVAIVRTTLAECRDEMLSLWRTLEQDANAPNLSLR